MNIGDYVEFLKMKLDDEQTLFQLSHIDIKNLIKELERLWEIEACARGWVKNQYPSLVNPSDEDCALQRAMYAEDQNEY